MCPIPEGGFPRAGNTPGAKAYDPKKLNDHDGVRGTDKGKDLGRADQLSAMGIGKAVAYMCAGGRVRRTGWNGKGMWIALQMPDAHSKMGLPYVYMKTATGQLVPWLCSQTDLLATDWESVEQ